MASVPNLESVEVNAKFLARNGVYSESYADYMMAKVRKALNKTRISVHSFCEFYRIGTRMFEE
ncbi:hypothetical protein [Runella sp.]|uniref:hypothetical protein n=1 Tax=Runella sp. TaxID=1960881 RepID=UPI003D14B907